MNQWQIAVAILISLLVLYFFTRTTKKISPYSEVKTKLPSDKCPSGYIEIGSTICAKN